MKTFCLITIVILLCSLTTFAQNPAEVMTHRGYTTEANLNTATSNGFYGVNRPGMDMSSLLTFNAFGSTGPVQQKITF